MSLEKVREEISRTDTEILRLIGRRQALAGEVAAIKEEAGIPVHDAGRTAAVLSSVSKQAGEMGLDPAAVRTIFTTLIGMSEDRQRAIRGQKKDR